MLHLDWVREILVLIGLAIYTGALALIYAALEKIFPFLSGGPGRLR